MSSNQEDKPMPEQEVKPMPEQEQVGKPTQLRPRMENFWVKYKWWIVLLLLCVLLLWLYMQQSSKPTSTIVVPVRSSDGGSRLDGADLNIGSPIDDISLATTGVPRLF